jgi:hypothetical protein
MDQKLTLSSFELPSHSIDSERDVADASEKLIWKSLVLIKVSRGPCESTMSGKCFASQAGCPMSKSTFSCGNASFNAEEILYHRHWRCQSLASTVRKWNDFVGDSQGILLAIDPYAVLRLFLFRA